MNNLVAAPTKLRMQTIFDAQKAAFLKAGPPDARLRKDRLNRCIGLLVIHQDDFVDALNEDFGARSSDMSRLPTSSASIAPAQACARQSGGWMKPQKRKVDPAPLALLGARAEVRYQPKGVVGIISPWNFPVQLDVRAARRRARRRQSHHAQAVRIHARDLGAARAPVRSLFRRGRDCGDSRRTRDRRRVRGPAVRSSDLYRRHVDRPPRHACGGGQSDAGDARAGRQVAGGRRAHRRHGQDGGARDGGQDHECRPDLPCARLCDGAAGERGDFVARGRRPRSPRCIRPSRTIPTTPR